MSSEATVLSNGPTSGSSVSSNANDHLPTETSSMLEESMGEIDDLINEIEGAELETSPSSANTVAKYIKGDFDSSKAKFGQWSRAIDVALKELDSAVSDMDLSKAQLADYQKLAGKWKYRIKKARELREKAEALSKSHITKEEAALIEAELKRIEILENDARSNYRFINQQVTGIAKNSQTAKSLLSKIKIANMKLASLEMRFDTLGSTALGSSDFSERISKYEKQVDAIYSMSDFDGSMRELEALR